MVNIHVGKHTLSNLTTCFHPWILITYFFLFPYINNIQQLNFSSYIFPQLIAYLFIGFLLFIINKIIKQYKISAGIVSISLIVFFSYGLIIKLFPRLSSFNNNEPYQFNSELVYSFITSIAILIFSLSIYYFLICKKDFLINLCNGFLMVFSIALISGLIFIGMYKSINMQSTKYFNARWQDYLNSNQITTNNNSSLLPDIYFIVLDGFGSSDVLENIYEYDNSQFINRLTNLGFTVMPDAKSNYSQTRLIFSSMLNMIYLDGISKEVGDNATDARPLIEMIKDNLVMRDLEIIGYTTISYTSENPYFTNINTDKKIATSYLFDNYLQQIFFNSILYPILHNSFYHARGNDINRIFQDLNNFKEESSPKFVLAYIPSPHPPFVFDENGNYVVPSLRYTEYDAEGLVSQTSTEYYFENYPKQVEYISSQTIIAIQSILKNSKNPPIIILCADHGPGLSVNQVDISLSNHYERMHILYALYLPGVDPKEIPTELAQVNTFRYIFNEYFGTNFELLDNKSYVSSFTYPYDFIDVTELSDQNQIH